MKIKWGMWVGVTDREPIEVGRSPTEFWGVATDSNYVSNRR